MDGWRFKHSIVGILKWKKKKRLKPGVTDLRGDSCSGATSVGLSQSSVLSSLDAPFSANTTALVTASLTLVMSSTSCAGTKQKHNIGLVAERGIVPSMTWPLTKYQLSGEDVLSRRTHSSLGAHTRHRDRESFTARSVHYSKPREDFAWGAAHAVKIDSSRKPSGRTCLWFYPKVRVTSSNG